MVERGDGTLLLCAFSMLCHFGNSEIHVKRTDVVDNRGTEYETSLGVDDFVRASSLKPINLTKLNIEVIGDPTLGKRTQGDIDVSHSTLHLLARDSGIIGKAAITTTYSVWPNRRIPYALSSYYGDYSRGIIAQAFAEYHNKTCVRFEPKTDDDFDYLFITPDDGCYSSIGRVGGKQNLSLTEGCIQFGTIIHELMHSTGFFHEQSRPDRDNYIDIQWENILPGQAAQFKEYGTDVADTLGEPYDYSSIMHYGPTAFSANGLPTIVAKLPGAENMGQRDGFTDYDLDAINKRYDCSVAGLGMPDVPSASAISISPGSSSKWRASTLFTNSPTPVEECVDTSWKCPYFMLADATYYCENDATVRETDCRKSCGTCTNATTTLPPTTTPSPNCFDEFNSNICQNWASIGHCSDSYSSYVRTNCKRSCNAC